jgi:GntR family transcriptional regulator
MQRTVQVDPADAAPIWRQIEESVRRLVASGALRPGGAVPSVRELARELRVNPATVAKAYQHLADAGVLAVRRGEGTFVAEAPPPMPDAERRRVLRDGATRYAVVAVTIGATRERTSAELDAAWARLAGDRKGVEP